jgi:uncharacterized protein
MAKMKTTVRSESMGSERYLLRAVVALTGGVLMAFGARLAEGWSRGHGISCTLQLSLAHGIPRFAFLSAVSVPHF